MRRKILAVSLAAIVVIAFSVAFLPGNLSSGGNEAKVTSPSGQSSHPLFTLAEPAFAAETQSEGTNFLEEEAGISAYTNVGQGIDLDKAKTAFKTVEHQTSEYIIGSVGLPEHGETEDVHCYVHKDGWVVAYYLKAEPAAKVINWADLSTTKLEEGLGKACNAAGVPFVKATYYNFKYADAEKLMVIIDKGSFKLKIPGSFVVYERSYSANFLEDDDGGYLYIDETQIVSGGTTLKVGTITPTQLKPEAFHIVDVKPKDDVDPVTVAIVLTYKEG